MGSILSPDIGQGPACTLLILLIYSLIPVPAESTVTSFSRQIKDIASAIGFDKTCLCNLETASPPNGRQLQDWVNKGYQAGMSWFARSLERRSDIRKAWPDARSLVVVATCYFGDTHSFPPFSSIGKMARFAWGKDYHYPIKARLRELTGKLQEIRPDLRGKIFCDDGPITEKHWAAQSGIGWIGKNSLLITPEYGSWVSLGVLALNQPLDQDPIQANRCNSCTLCMEKCPTKAIVAPGVVDARRCLSYWNIESRDAIPTEIRTSMDSWIYGCDLCQEACPWNQGHPKNAGMENSGHPKFSENSPGAEVHPTTVPQKIAEMTEEEFKELFQGSVIFRLGRIRLLRNMIIAIASGRDRRFHPFLEKTARDRQDILGEYARWALSRMIDRS